MKNNDKITKKESISVDNRKVFKDYEILDSIEAGIVLKGHEIKSIRLGNINLAESYIRIDKEEAFLLGCHISPYKFTRLEEIDPLRERKLLLKKSEIIKLDSKIAQKGLTIVPIKLYIKSGKVKILIGLGKGKNVRDKREDIKKKEANRKIERALSHRN